MRIDFDEYSHKAGLTAIYPHAGTGSAIALAYLGLGLGEAGEVQGKLKKVLRDDDGVITEQRRLAVLDELGDVLWYLDRLSTELGSTLADVACANLAKLQARQAAGTLQGSGDTR